MVSKRALLLLLIFCIFTVSAQLDEKVDAVEDKLDQASNIANQVSDSETRNEYLKQEWKKILDRGTVSGPLIRFIDAILNFLNPLFKAILGVEYSLSWAFIFASIIWLVLFAIISPIAASMLGKALGLLTGAIIASIIGIAGVIKGAVNALSFVISNLWIAWIALGVSLLVGALFFILSKYAQKYIEKQKGIGKKEKLDQDQKIIRVKAKSIEEELED